MDTGRIKIGNGVDAWLDLPYLGEDGTGVVNAATRSDFPSVGNVNYIYKAADEKKIYQWNDIDKTYEALAQSEGGSGGEINITKIHGGDADGIL